MWHSPVTKKVAMTALNPTYILHDQLLNHTKIGQTIKGVGDSVTGGTVSRITAGETYYADIANGKKAYSNADALNAGKDTAIGAATVYAGVATAGALGGGAIGAIGGLKVGESIGKGFSTGNYAGALAGVASAVGGGEMLGDSDLSGLFDAFGNGLGAGSSAPKGQQRVPASQPRVTITDPTGLYGDAPPALSPSAVAIGLAAIMVLAAITKGRAVS